jgi:cyclic beta-1,2-glucan synthetase
MTTSSAEPRIASPLPSRQPLILPALAPDSREPIRGDLYGLESLEADARALAEYCSRTARVRHEGPLLQRLAHNRHVLVDAHRRISDLAGRREALSPDAEWLLDNFYIVEDVLREVRHDLPRGYYRELPKLAEGPLAGYPRVYALALDLIAHTDSSLDEDHIRRFAQAYQTVTPLTIGELWAVPTMFRLGLLENLRRLAEHTLAAWEERRRAETWTAHLVSTGLPPDGRGRAQGRDPCDELPPGAGDTFVVRALQVLRDAGDGDALERLEVCLTVRGLDAAEVVRRENQRQAGTQVSVGNCVTSLRLLSALDWGAFFEKTNLVEPVLRLDPAGVYAGQDFATRDRYRQAVEKLARRSPRTEVEVARRAVEQASRAGGPDTDRRRHVGYYLVGPGLSAFKAELGYRPSFRDWLLAGVLDHPRATYFGSIAAITALLLALLGSLAWEWAPPGPAGLALTLLVLAAALLPVSELAVGLVNHVLTLFLPPRTLPKLDFKDGMPADCLTFVVMPSMLVRPESAATLLDRLEIHYLANPDPQLCFALLTDFADADTEHRPEDEDYVRAALDGVAALNRRYAGDGPPRFFLFHRRRQWNPVQRCWMGWERKRGKLAEFNRLLRGDRNTSYTTCSCDPAAVPRAPYVITLDLDTELPRETARRLVGTLAHPLNQAHFDPQRGRVVEGYAILQPRVSFHMPAARRSLFTQIWVSSAGIDPYSTAVSDIYQDLFGAGTFTGKGIYDVDAFEAAVGQTFPDNHVLSHDLIEGNYARCGLVTDIELFDDFPARYHAYARREHRWVRGDWQLLPWLGRTVPVPEPARSTPTRRPNPLPLLERWKLFDNLRRSLVPPALALGLALAWTVLPLPWWMTTGLAVLVLALPLLLQALGTLVAVVRSGSWTALREFCSDAPATLGQVVLGTVFLLHQAAQNVDAIVRTLVRLFVTRRHLLEWETAAAAERRLGTGVIDFCRTMWQAPALAALGTALVAALRPGMLPAAVPFLAAWLLSPLVAFWVSRPLRTVVEPLPPAERLELCRIARRTWAFFETFVGPEDHWLPPDNYQEEPHGQVAHRTSPTNQGLLLLSTLAAHDFGYLSLGGLATRLGNTLDTLEHLERFRGHFYNWYDTLTLEPLQPAYVSTVDSGNLLGCLLTLKQGLAEKLHEPVIGPACAAGLADTLAVVTDLFRGMRPPEAPEAAGVYRELERRLASLEGRLGEVPSDLPGWRAWLAKMRQEAIVLPAEALRLADLLYPVPPELETWAERLAVQVEERCVSLKALAPWLELPADHGPPADPKSPRQLRWEAVRRKLTEVFTLADFTEEQADLAAELAALAEDPGVGADEAGGLRRLRAAVEASVAGALLAHCRRLADLAEALAAAMDFRFLYKPDRHLFSIGYNVPQGRLDVPSYDLLASEARLASFLAIARGDVPRRHWFHLGRLLTRVEHQLCLLSWGGTMFEYLMPDLLLRRYPATLLAESSQAAVARQIAYGRARGVPWGISESAFSSQHASFDYQYQSFGVPGLGLKRGLDQDLVIAPYATALAATVRPHDAVCNLRRLAGEGAAGRYGFYESVDYTRNRLPPGRRSLVVRCFMAHHQGMSLLALVNCLLGDPMPRRFHLEPMVRATELLLQERVPRAASPLDTSEQEAAPRAAGPGGPSLVSRRLTTPSTPAPRTHLLSNGRYTVMVTNAGSGFSTCDKLDVTRWREDLTRDCWGQFIYVRDRMSGAVWSAGYQPVCRPTEQYEVLYCADKAEFSRADGEVVTHLEITVSPESCAEVRRVTLANVGTRPCELELTSYAEIVLGPHGADLAHPAFGKLFLETEWVPEQEALLCRRRPRSSEQQPVWAVHLATVDGQPVHGVEWETDRGRFLGRGRTPAAPAALDPGARLSGTTGPVLDPVFSLRRRVRVAPGASASVTFCTAVAGSREEALGLADHFRDPQAGPRVFDLAWAHSQVELRHLHLTTAEAHLFQRLAAPLLYAGAALRADPAVLAGNRQGQPGLWKHGISGDRPILLVQVNAADQVALVRQVLAAHTYWRLKGFEVDLVVLSEEPSGYFEEQYQQVQEAVRTSDAHALVDRPGGVFVRKAAQLTEEDRLLLRAAARVVLTGDRGTLAAQLERAERAVPLPVAASVPLAGFDADERASGTLAATAERASGPPAATESAMRLPPDLLFQNGLGGFTPDGREYLVLPYGPDGAYRPPPAPWVNVVANPHVGFLVSESGLGALWAGNSQLNRLTPWSNDPVTDSPSAVVYLRDEATGEVWTPTPRPLGAALTLVRHGQGYTVFEQVSHGLSQTLLTFVPAGDPLQILVLTVRNPTASRRQLSATYYVEWVLGTTRDQMAMHVHTEVDSESGALLARNPFNPDFPQVAFADVGLRPRSLTGDRTAFLGRNGSPAAPEALGRAKLAGRVGAGLDPCAAVQARFEVPPGEEREVVFVLGAAPDPAAVRQLVERYREPARARAAFDEVRRRWEGVLTAVQVHTPDPALDVLVNRWLPYQVLSCRLWGRTALYQSGGAYGFRDQLQDVMALLYGAPGEARAHLLRAAAHQFLKGDVQHWWHPTFRTLLPGGGGQGGEAGVRTHISDDYLWLPFAVSHYVTVTGDAAVLDEQAPYLRAPLLRPDQEDEYGQAEFAGVSGTLYDHCVRALEHGLRFGPHGLPLMGTGDWNDGMNRVGAGGRGETVWGGWLLLTCLRRFADLAEARGETARAASWREQAGRVHAAIEEHAWDGAWYRRAYFDDGKPLGSAADQECRIDSLSQSWAVLSGAAAPDRARRAMAAVDEYLVRRADRLILLFTPPFDRGPLQPGYVKGYVPGIRENGGQYTHAAAWVVQAAALLGQGTHAAELFGLLNPVRHANTPEGVARYRIEPYVVAGDVYGAPPHTGRGGWSWYTGSASWLFRAAVETILGLRLRGSRLDLAPRIPGAWPCYEITLHYRSSIYHITVENPHGAGHGVAGVLLDGAPAQGNSVHLEDDGRAHAVRVTLGRGGG